MPMGITQRGAEKVEMRAPQRALNFHLDTSSRFAPQLQNDLRKVVLVGKSGLSSSPSGVSMNRTSEPTSATPPMLSSAPPTVPSFVPIAASEQPRSFHVCGLSSWNWSLPSLCAPPTVSSSPARCDDGRLPTCAIDPAYGLYVCQRSGWWIRVHRWLSVAGHVGLEVR